MPTLLAKNAEVLVTMDDERREIPGGGLFVRENLVEHVGPTSELPSSADVVLDLSGQVVLPGFVNTHHHLDQTLTRALPAAQNADLFAWLKAHYRVWARKSPAATRTSTLIGLAELASSGCTTVFDHSYVWQSGSRVDDQIAAAKEIGVRFHASRGSMSLGESKGGLPPDECTEDEDLILEDSKRVIETYHDTSHGSMIWIALAPCSPFSVSADLLASCAELARRYESVGLHTHLCETLDEERYTLETYGMRPVEWMETVGWLGGDVWYAHAIHVNASEIASFASTGCGVAHCPSSNMRLASGMAPYLSFRRAGVKVGIGVDGSASSDASNMILELRQTMLLARLGLGLSEIDRRRSQTAVTDPPESADWVTARDVLELGTRGGASLLGRDDIGHLAPGMCADFFSIDLNSIDYAGGLHDPVASVIFCAPQRAKTTVINGQVVVSDGHIVTLDMAPIVQEHNRLAAEMAADGA